MGDDRRSGSDDIRHDRPLDEGEPDGVVSRPEDSDEPTGAIVVTTFLTAVILLSWFGLFALFMLRG